MTPKEKALDLFNKMIVDFSIDKWQSQQCALVAVDEIIKAINDKDIYIQGETNIDDFVKYWQEVKQEIEKL